jgi:hypothetical protein
VPPTTPATPASPAPKANTTTNTSWILTPVADSMSRSSTPARIIMPMMVLLSASHINTPMTTEAQRMTIRTTGYFMYTACPELFTAVISGSLIAPNSQSGVRI